MGAAAMVAGPAWANGKARASFAGGPGAWRGAIRVGKRIAWKCEHSHANRENSTGYCPVPATLCASYALQAATDEAGTRERIAKAEEWRAHCTVRLTDRDRLIHAHQRAAQDDALANAPTVREAIAKAEGR